MNKQIQAVIFDWAGTTIDYGCFAPVQVFIAIFRKRNVEITNDEAREPMGLLKIDHIRAILSMERVHQTWVEAHGEAPGEEDIQELYHDFEKMLFRILDEFAQPIPGVIDVVNTLKDSGIKIGSTTGYTSDMIDIISKEAKKQGYVPDAVVTSSDVPAGRPAPWMCYQNAMKLNVYPLSQMVKAGDTASDMEEGRNAGMWTVGIVKGSSTLGFLQEEIEEMDKALLHTRIEDAKQTLFDSGAHFVIEEIHELPSLIQTMNQMMNKEESFHV
ncbi:phosphonoacetaldehyde hydrolase [Salibacterium halotolerans]|uniref:Phosphonoacetaldehyde hydrolase n=1 Tax=Salibacterium halotolerans TaxID=1884432 RepID=A0A1I5W1P7_9BACI|nr:phosphonoacetaldehyde hydrolase [Salibacterium halotolerans]SFQ13176.1 phosphonoacetaldehyde hydrolase [Salibacterium halotolerans]